MADYRFPGEHVYENMVLEEVQKVENVEKVKHLTAVDGDILIASYPKTGTTWMEELTWLVSKEGDTTEALSTPLTKRMLFLEFIQSYHNGKSGIEMLDSAERPAIMKTHLPATFFEKQLAEGQLKFILTIRNPKDTLVSLYHFYRMNSGLGNFTGTWNEFFELYKTKHVINGDFFDWYASWIPHLDKPNVQLYAYEDMKADLKPIIERLANFINKTVPTDKIDTIVQHTYFKSMKANKMVNNEHDAVLKKEISPFIRKGQVGDWTNYFSPEQSLYVEEEYKIKLQKRGITLKFE